MPGLPNCRKIPNTSRLSRSDRSEISRTVSSRKVSTSPLSNKRSPVRHVGGLHPEDAGKRRNLAHRRVADGAGPYSLDVSFREITQRHASNLGIRVTLSCLRVPYGVEEVLDFASVAAAPAVRYDWCPVADALIEPRSGANPIALVIALSFS